MRGDRHSFGEAARRVNWFGANWRLPERKPGAPAGRIAEAGPEATGPARPQQDKQDCRLWERTGSPREIWPLSEARVLLAGFPSEELSDLHEALRAIGVRIVAHLPHVHQLRSVARSEGIFTHILIDFDGYDEVETGVEDLIEFRKISKGNVVVLLSRSVAVDDLDSDRKAICDATLRLPVTRRRLETGLIAATRNHEIG